MIKSIKSVKIMIILYRGIAFFKLNSQVWLRKYRSESVKMIFFYSRKILNCFRFFGNIIFCPIFWLIWYSYGIIPLYTPEKWAIFGNFSYDSYNKYLYVFFGLDKSTLKVMWKVAITSQFSWTIFQPIFDEIRPGK